MKPGLLRLTSIAALALAASIGLDAFGEAGHRIVGYVAESHLRQSRALGEVRRILASGETLAEASLWPDTIKSAAYEDVDTGPFRLEHPAHDTYHYTNIAFQAMRYDERAPGAHSTDIVRMTRECIRVLRGSSQAFTPREALRLLAHLVGDMHQPLHIGNAFVGSQPPLSFVLPQGPTGWRSTLGGNALRYGPDDSFNLHSYWDTHIVNVATRKEDPAAYALRLVRDVPVATTWAGKGDVAEWPDQWASEMLADAKEAHKGIRITAYLGPDPDGRTPHRWRIEQPSGYDDASKARVRIQLAKGGYRLAAMLRAIFPAK
jgi:hypothetical protein